MHNSMLQCVLQYVLQGVPRTQCVGSCVTGRLQGVAHVQYSVFQDVFHSVLQNGTVCVLLVLQCVLHCAAECVDDVFQGVLHVCCRV